MKTLIFGGTSDVAKELVYKLISIGHEVVLFARNSERLAPLKKDVEVRYNVNIAIEEYDVLSPSNIQSMIEQSDNSIILVGYLGDQDQAEQDDNELLRIIDVNYGRLIPLINKIGEAYKRKQSGVIVGVSSVAGERGKQSNFAYGSAKAGLSVYLDGLRNRLFKHGVHVVTVKPGFMKTRMIQGMTTPSFLAASPMVAADQIIKAMLKRKNTIYIKPIWKWVMMVIKCVPEGIFKKMSM